MSANLKFSYFPINADIYVICVPTPLKDNFKPDIGFVKSVVENLSTKPGVIFEIEDKIDEIRIATAYFSPEGFARISSMIKNIPSIKCR